MMLKRSPRTTPRTARTVKREMVIDTARQMANQHPLRAYDAVQLATAWSLDQNLVNSGESPLTFICADDRLLAVAQAEGLRTENPNHHP